ncbi:hypothetical protein L202_04729 [Cryptococcus amylolentus CBS 6039]|uniref:Pre-rRNA-processing protein n=1 Tax=Cryptococcus amylolentus CBS 6039 TaxID=1295533 RepID=A0A1E3HMJ2_9TREE|nr:hypothetical protein L202_04729 [Cryptococcus amylolentus CBS 6039]ODN77559.1 hypothetical protein L202_04729 [Cryptococcus amylolentus CBS 6039]
MPKATAKKKEKKADFVKVKLKLGKGKKSASNATDTSFKARSIALPGQEALNRALLVSEGNGPSEPTTANGLTLEDLLNRLRHPNSGVRKETLGGIKEILQQGIGKEIGKVLRALGGLVADDDAGVRKGLLGLLGWYLAHLPMSALSPHLPLLVLQTSSALSHIFPEIRLDACKLVHLLLQHVPAHVLSQWPYESSNILEGLRLAVGLGGEKGVNSSIGRLTGGAKLVTMKAMREFVRVGLDSGEERKWGAGWVREGGKREGKRKEVRKEPMLEDLALESWLVGAQGLKDICDGGNVWEVGRLGSHGGQGNEAGVVSVLSQLYIQLHPLLLSTFLENAPTAFSPSAPTVPTASEDIPLQLCVATASLTELLANAILTRAPAESNLPELKEVKTCIFDFQRRMTAWFPFASRTAPTPSGVTPGFELSLAYADLALLLAPRPVELVYPTQVESRAKELGWRERVKATEEAWKKMQTAEKGAKGKGKAGQSQWAMEEVAEWVVDVLAPSQDALVPSLTPEAYKALLPIVWDLLVQPPASTSEQADTPSLVGTSLLNHLLRQSSTSLIRELGDQFLISLIEVHEQKYMTLPFYLPPSSSIRPLIQGWFDSIPRTLFELGPKAPSTTQHLLRFLLSAALQAPAAYPQPYSLLDFSGFSQFTQKLAAFFWVKHSKRGDIPGAWVKLEDKEVKRLGLDVAKAWAGWDQGGKLAEAVRKACEGSEGEWGQYWRR